MQWILGEKRYVHTTVSEGVAASADCTVYDCEDESVVTSGVATVSGEDLYFLWQPSEAGIYVADFLYVIGSEELSNRQIVEVKETV